MASSNTFDLPETGTSENGRNMLMTGTAAAVNDSLDANHSFVPGSWEKTIVRCVPAAPFLPDRTAHQGATSRSHARTERVARGVRGPWRRARGDRARSR